MKDWIITDVLSQGDKTLAWLEDRRAIPPCFTGVRRPSGCKMKLNKLCLGTSAGFKDII